MSGPEDGARLKWEMIHGRYRAPSESDNVAPDHYFGKFENSGIRKATRVIQELRKYKGGLSRGCMYLSIGGATGSEVKHVLESTDIAVGILAELDHDACEYARRHANYLATQGKHLEVMEQDVVQRVDAIVKKAMDLRNRFDIDTLVLSAQAIFHELPTRSRDFDLHIFLSKLFAKWDRLLFVTREPCRPIHWGPQIDLFVPKLAPDLIRQFALDIAYRLDFADREVRPLGDGYVRMSSDLAVEFLTKLFYRADMAYELEERVTALDGPQFVRLVSQVLDGGTIEHAYLTSDSFSRLYEQYGVKARRLDRTNEVCPTCFVSVVAARGLEREAELLPNSDVLPQLQQLSFGPSTRPIAPPLQAHPEGPKALPVGKGANGPESHIHLIPFTGSHIGEGWNALIEQQLSRLHPHHIGDVDLLITRSLQAVLSKGVIRRNWDIDLSFNFDRIEEGFVREQIIWDYEFINVTTDVIDYPMTLYSYTGDINELLSFTKEDSFGNRSNVFAETDVDELRHGFFTKRQRVVPIHPNVMHHVRMGFVLDHPVSPAAHYFHNSTAPVEPCINARIRARVPTGYRLDVLGVDILRPVIDFDYWTFRIPGPILPEQIIEYAFQKERGAGNE